VEHGATAGAGREEARTDAPRGTLPGIGRPGRSTSDRRPTERAYRRPPPRTTRQPWGNIGRRGPPGPRRPPRSRTARAGARPKRSNRKPHAARTGSVPPAWGRLDSFSIGGGDDHERTLTASRAQRLDRPYVGQGLHQRPGP